MCGAWRRLVGCTDLKTVNQLEISKNKNDGAAWLIVKTNRAWEWAECRSLATSQGFFAHWHLLPPTSGRPVGAA